MSEQSKQSEQQTAFREKPYITAQLPTTENYKLVRALTMNLDEYTNLPIVDINKFIGEIFTGFKVFEQGHVREWAGMAAAIVVDDTRTIMASQMYDAAFDPKHYDQVTTYSDYYSKRTKVGGARITWLGAPAIVYTYKNRNRLVPFLSGSLVINSMFWITSFSSAKCFDDYGKDIEMRHPGYLRTELLEKINANKDQAIIDSDSGTTKYIFAFDIDDTLCKQEKEEEKEKTKKKAKKKTNLSIAQTSEEFIINIIAKMKQIIQTRNYVWIITANNYPKYQFLDIYFANSQDKEFFKNSEYFYYMNNTNISLIYEDAKKFFPDDKLLDQSRTIDKVHEEGLKPYALYAQSLIEKYNYNTRHEDSKIGRFKIYLFDDSTKPTLEPNCKKFDIEFKLVTDFTTNEPVLVGYLDEILREEKFISQTQTQEQTQEQTQAPEQRQRDEIQTQPVSLYCDKYENLKQFCRKSEFQKYNTYKNYYVNPDQDQDEGEFLTSLDESIKRIKDEDAYLKKFNEENATDYYQRYNEIYSYVYPWDMEGIEIGAIDRAQTASIINMIKLERSKVKTELAEIIKDDNLKDSFKRINMIIYIIINNPDYANIIYDYINNKRQLKITYTLFLLTKLILLSKCNIDDIFTNIKFEFSLGTDEDNIKNLVTEIIRIMEEPLKFYEYTFNEKTKCFEMKTIQSFERRISDLILFRQDDEEVKAKFRGILCTKKSEIQLTNKKTSYMSSYMSNMLTSIKGSRKPMKIITIEPKQTLKRGGIKRRYRRDKSRINKSRINKSRINKSRRNKSRINKSRRNKSRRNKSRRKHKKN